MKKLLFYPFFFFFLSLNGCHNDDNTTQTLPAATQTGKGIFACYVDGKPFIDNSGAPNAISFNCFYQYVGGQYHFGIGGNVNNSTINSVNVIGIATNGLQISQNSNFQLLENQLGNAYGSSNIRISPTDVTYTLTSIEYTGQLKITRLDMQNQIVSGTFWMNLKHPITGDTIKITDGRFDTHFGL